MYEIGRDDWGEILYVQRKVALEKAKVSW